MIKGDNNISARWKVHLTSQTLTLCTGYLELSTVESAVLILNILKESNTAECEGLALEIHTRQLDLTLNANIQSFISLSV